MGKKLTIRQQLKLAAERELAVEKREQASKAKQEKAERERGRKSLMGLDDYGFQAALDAVIDGTVKTPYVPFLSGYETRSSGKCYYDLLHFTREEMLKDAMRHYKYARLRYCPTRFIDLLKQAFPESHRTIQTFARGKAYPVLVFDKKIVLALFSAIWPNEWRKFGCKYIDLYTEKRVAELEAAMKFASEPNCST